MSLRLFRGERGQLLLQALHFSLGELEQRFARFDVWIDAGRRFQATEHGIGGFDRVLLGFDEAGAVPKYLRVERDRTEWARRGAQG